MMDSNATVAMPNTGSIGGERTQFFVLPERCAMDVSPCPLLTGAMSPDDGFCRECGVMLGAPLGEGMLQRPLPKLIDMQGREFALHVGQNIVGREGADIMLPDKTVSRRHAVIGVEETGAVWVEDTGSTNGTTRDNVPLERQQRAYLADGMTLQFGSIRVKVVIPAGVSVDLDALPAPERVSREENVPALAAPGGATPAAVLVGFDGSTHVLTSTNTTFGRRPGNTIVLTGDSYISGSHAQITYENDRFLLTDLGSTNGTKVNGQRLAAHTPVVLNEGDEVMMGQTTFIYHSPTNG
ncbi:MAG: FHA domain-containing protein [Capsulimonadales bacterium]|nr:FHA domain-containing protein [Capsulimonadales bacterium]